MAIPFYSMIETFLKGNLPAIRSGDTVRVYQKIKEGDKERIQLFEGLVIADKHGRGINGTITVRKIASGVGVERIFPLHSPTIEKIEVVKQSKVRRAKLYYLRDAKGRNARLKAKVMKVATSIVPKPVSAEPTPVIQETPAAEPSVSPEAPSLETKKE